MHDEVYTVIAGGKTPERVIENSKASALPSLNVQTMEKVNQVYETQTKPQIYYRW